MKRRKMVNKEEIAEDFCFICKDGGHLRVCDYGDCLKAYHPGCVNRDPSFLNSEETWSCGWHSCFICKKSSRIRCFCCPNSVCFKCITEAEFVQVKMKSRGFCSNCLKLSILIERKADVDSDGEAVNFEDTETYEFLFKDYWEIVKDKEKLCLEDLLNAKAAMEKGNNFMVESGTERLSDEEEVPSDMVTGGSCDKEFSFSEEVDRKSFKSKTPKSIPPKKRSFVSWGSDALMNFLACIGRDTSKPYTQHDIAEIVKGYVYENNLLDPIKKKKRVLCDDNLLSLFRKKTVKLFKIHDLLEPHFSAFEDDEDDFLLGLEEEEDFVNCKRKSRANFDAKRAPDSKNCAPSIISYTMDPLRSLYASLSEKNIKLIFLRRSLVLELLKEPDHFEAKVMGSFVRVKNDPKDIFHSPDKVYQLGQVASIKRAQEAYKIGDIYTDFVLQIPSIWKDVRISMLSEDDFEEEECENLRQLVKKGLHPRPLMIDFENKVSALHKDITIHWINRELALLAKKIDRANEKGWRREFFDLMERKKLLSTSSEQERLLKEIPEVVPDEDKLLDNVGSEPGCEEKRNVLPKKAVEGTPIFSSISEVCADIELTQVLCKGRSEETSEQLTKPIERMPVSGITEIGICSEEKIQKDADSRLICKEDVEEKQEILWTPVKQTQFLGVTKVTLHDKAVGKEQDNKEIQESAKASPVFTIDLNSSLPERTCPSEVVVINLEDDEDEHENGNPVAAGNNKENVSQLMINSGRNAGNDTGWHYLDPAGNVQGPFMLNLLGFWRDNGFFDDNFRVWKQGHPQSESDPVA